jgi:hypothetical protein
MPAANVSSDNLIADAIAKMDAIVKRMDALETGEGSKNPVTKGDDDDDKKSKRDDAKSKADDDDDDDDKKADTTAVKNKILDDAAGSKKKSDASEVPPPPLKKDSKKADAKKSDDGELEIKHEPEKKGDSKKTDAAKKADDDDDDDDDDDKKDDALTMKTRSLHKDDDDDDKKDDAVAKADDIGDLKQQLLSQAAIIAKLQSMMKPRSDDEHAAFADAQAKADAVFQGFGKHAPRPLEGEDVMDYRKRLAKDLKIHSPRWSKTKFSRMDDETFGQIEEQVYADATTAAANPVDLEAGELRMVTKVDPATGMRSNVFYGKESFVKQMGRPGRRVAAFRTLSSV